MKGKIERYYYYLKKINNIKTTDEALQLLNEICLENFPIEEENRLKNKIAIKDYVNRFGSTRR